MTEQAPAQQVPTFKLVLVGDGGTGKVREDLIDREGHPCPELVVVVVVGAST